MICIYHRTDFDGICSAAIVKYKYPNCRFYGIDYVDNFDLEKIKPNEEVVMVDFTLRDNHYMQKIWDRSSNFIWIDHHNTSLELEKEEKLLNLPGIRKIGVGACELTWHYFFQTKIPLAVYLLSRYDVWENDNPCWESQILPFQYGMRLNYVKPDDLDFWKNIFISELKSETINRVLHDGTITLNYEKELNARIAKGLWFPLKFENLNFQVINRSHANFLSAESIWNPEKFDAVMYYCRGREKWRITMFTDKDIDLSVIAKKHGGGGHKQACGFATENIMDVLPELINF